MWIKVKIGEYMCTSFKECATAPATNVRTCDEDTSKDDLKDCMADG